MMAWVSLDSNEAKIAARGDNQRRVDDQAGHKIKQNKLVENGAGGGNPLAAR
jgi:hypothetical protein